MKVVKRGIHFYDSDKQYHKPFYESNLTIKISSSFNVGYIFDTKNFYGSLCAFSSSKSPMLRSVYFQ